MIPFDANGAFHPIVEDAGLRGVAVRSAGITVFSQGVGFAVQMIAIVFLARLLAPGDFGLVTMVTTFSLLLTSFGLNGFTEAVLQREEIDHFLASNLFWINLAIGVLLTVGLAASGPLLARFYHAPHISHVAVGMSLTILLTSISVLHLALLKRAMRFSAISANEVFARVVSVVVSILLARIGWGYWALVAGTVAYPFATSIGAWALCRWVPSFPRPAPGTASMARFALNIYGRFSINYFTRNMDNLLVGLRFGEQSLGFYKKAYDLFVLPANQLLSPMAAVAISTLSRTNRNSVQHRRHFLGGLSVLALIGMGIGANLTLLGNDLIRVLLGPGWEQAGRIFTFFGPGIGIMLLYTTHGWIHLSIGRADRWFRWGIVEFSVTGLLFLLAWHWGPVAIAGAWTASFWILSIPAFWYAGKPIGLGIRQIISAVWRSILSSLLAGCVCRVIMYRTFSPSIDPGMAASVSRIVAVSLLFGVLYLIAIVLLHWGFAPLAQVRRLLAEMAPRAQFARWCAGAASGTGAGTAVAVASSKLKGDPSGARSTAF